MPTIGMPKVKIEFESMGLTAIQRSERGVCLLLLKEETVKEKTKFKFTSLADVKKKGVIETVDSSGEKKTEQVEGDFSDDVYKYVDLAFEAAPNKLLVRTYDEKTVKLDDVLKELTLERFDHYAAPNATKEDLKTILSWHKKMKLKAKTIQLTVFGEEADEETIINWSTPYVVYDGVRFTGQEFTALVSSQLAALPLTRSFTYFSWPKVSEAGLPFAEDEDKAVNAGKLFLTYDGEKYKIARAVNSLITYYEDKGEDFSKIRIIEAMHLIRNDIGRTWDEFYVGKILNKYENKQQFIALVNQVYFKQLEDAVLEARANSHVDIDMERNRMYAVTRGADVDDLTEMQIKTYNTGSNLFLAGTVSLLDAMEDLKIKFRNQ